MYSKHYSTRRPTPQNQPAPGKNQVKNSAGGYVFQVGDWDRLNRFLILGTEGGAYYATEKTLTVDNAEAVLRCINEDGPHVVKTVTELSQDGRAPKNDPALFVLAMCAALGDEPTRKAAFAALGDVARTGTHLFQFIENMEGFRGWGRAAKRAVASWYLSKTPEQLAYQLVKYRQRNGWSHRDVLRLSHPTPLSTDQQKLFKWAVSGEWNSVENGVYSHLSLVQAFESAQNYDGPNRVEFVAGLIRQHNLPRESLPTDLLKEKAIWEALLERMPMTALIRNLGNLSKVGLLIPGNWDVITKVVNQITNQDYLRKARVHPISVLAALTTYEQGHGTRGDGQWQVVPQVVDALDKAFYLAFGNIESTGKRWLLGLDISGSMSYGEVAGIPGLTPAKAAAAMAMVTARTEQHYAILGFAHEFRNLGITANMSLPEVLRKTEGQTFGGTDCALPMLYALKHNLAIDMFCVYTDNETWFGNIHPFQALKQYRQKTGINAKLAVFGLEANGFSIADPSDPGMIDFVGMDASAPQALAEFAKM